MYHFTCQWCGSSFSAERKNAKYCCLDCYTLARGGLPGRVSLIHRCETCGKSFSTHQENPRFCSHDCYAKSLIKPKQLKLKLPMPSVMRECLVCGQTFKPDDSAHKFCSVACSRKAQQKTPLRRCDKCGKEYQQRAVRATKGFCSVQCAGLLPIPPIVQPCAFCGKTFTSRPVDKRRFCSRECADSSRRGETYGKKRTRHFSPRRKQLIRERDGFKCVLCGSDDRLQVDHIIPVRLGGTNDVGNGRTLCHACHVKKTAEDKAAIRARLTQR